MIPASPKRRLIEKSSLYLLSKLTTGVLPLQLAAHNWVARDPDRDASLRSPDFFGTNRFPTWRFASTRIVPEGSASFETDGNLTIHGVTQLARLTVTVSGDAVNPIYHATARIDRHVFGMRTTRLDPAIGEIADVTLDVRLSR